MTTCRAVFAIVVKFRHYLSMFLVTYILWVKKLFAIETDHTILVQQTIRYGILKEAVYIDM